MTLAIFIYGLLGAFAVDFERLYVAMAERNNRIVGFPRAYRQPSFWVMRVVHSLIGGSVTVAWSESFPNATPLALMAVGGAAGLILDRFGRFVTKDLNGGQ